MKYNKSGNEAVKLEDYYKNKFKELVNIWGLYTGLPDWRARVRRQ